MATPRVTVIIPTFNRAHWLKDAMAAALAQDFEDFELVISDNASTDQTRDVVAAFDDPRVRLIRRPENVGLLNNHNLALEEVETEYCMVVPDDDVMGPGLLSATVAALETHADAAIAHTRFDMIDGDGRIVAGAVDWTSGLTDSTVESGDQFLEESMRWSCRVCASTCLMRTDPARAAGFFQAEDFPPIDLGLWLRLARSWKVVFLAENHGAFRIHGESASAEYAGTFEAGYVHGTEIIRRVRAVKERFLVDHEDQLGAARASDLRRLANTGQRHELIAMVRNMTLPRRRFGLTVRALRSAAAVDPRVTVEPQALRLLASSVLGGRIVDALKMRSSSAK